MYQLFTSSLGLRVGRDELIRELIGFMRVAPEARYKIVIGSDSLRMQGNNADFVTAVVVHRVGNGGRYFWRRADLGKFYTLRDRIIQEVLLSLDVAKELLENLKKESVGLHWDFEIHADIGEVGATKVLIQEVVGMIRANNFEAKTKPDSYGASKVADRHVQG